MKLHNLISGFFLCQITEKPTVEDRIVSPERKYCTWTEDWSWLRYLNPAAVFFQGICLANTGCGSSTQYQDSFCSILLPCHAPCDSLPPSIYSRVIPLVKWVGHNGLFYIESLHITILALSSCSILLNLLSCQSGWFTELLTAPSIILTPHPGRISQLVRTFIAHARVVLI